MLERKYIKSVGKSQISLSFIASLGNDVRRKLHMVGIHSNVEKRAKRMSHITVETFVNYGALSINNRHLGPQNDGTSYLQSRSKGCGFFERVSNRGWAIKLFLDIYVTPIPLPPFAAELPTFI